MKKITNTMVSTEGENLREVTSVTAEEDKSEDWENVKALQTGK